jgi:LytS/YehU family sensor histidine kinase
VRHGIAPVLAGGRVAITVRDRPGFVEVTVRDDGQGSAAGGGNGPGGLANLRDRLEALYGDAARLEARPLPGRGFLARLEVPRT